MQFLLDEVAVDGPIPRFLANLAILPCCRVKICLEGESVVASRVYLVLVLVVVFSPCQQHNTVIVLPANMMEM